MLHFKSTPVFSSLLSTLILLATLGNTGVKIALSEELGQLAIKSATEVMPSQSKAEPSSSPTNAARPYTVKVFFPKNPQSNNNFTYVEPVNRTTRSQSLARFAIEQVIAGPTQGERQKGFIGAIQLRDRSNCGADFNLSISNGTARLQFCRTIVSGGVGDDARAKSSLTASLKQFSTVQSIIILDRNGNCLGDMSGENRCLSGSR